MYKEKKVSKFVLICCSILIALSTMLAINPIWINNVYGSTLCSTTSLPNITSAYFNYKDSNLPSLYDGYISFYGISAQGVAMLNSVTFTNGGFGWSDATTGFDFYHYTYNSDDGTISLQYSLTNQSISRTLSQFNFTNVSDFYNYSNRIEYVGLLGGNYSHLFIFGIPNTKYCVYFDYSLYSKHLAYKEGVDSAAGTYDDGYNAGYTAGQTAGEQTGYQNGYTAGYTEGEGVGYNTGWQEGINSGYTNGQNSVLNHPSDYDLYTQSQYDNNYNTGYQNGENNVINNPEEFDLYTQDQFEGNYNTGYNAGLDVGEQTGYSNGYGVGYAEGETEGYSDGYNDGISKDISFKNLIFAVVDVPVETVRSLFNFDLLGFNLYNFFVAILTACVLVILIKLVIKGK